MDLRRLHSKFGFMLLVATCVAGAMAAPALALAQNFTVDSTGDQVDETVGSGGCKTSVNTCTLRAAIEEANASVAADEITFAPTVFTGQSSGTISRGAEFQTIVNPVTIDGGTCLTQAGVSGPCVGVSGAGLALKVESPDVTVEGVAFTPPSTYTGRALIVSGSPRFKAIGDWFGTSLAGTYAAFEWGAEVNSAGITMAGEAAEFSGDKISCFFIGVNLQGPGALIRQTAVEAGTIGVYTFGANASIGSQIEGSIVSGNVEAGIALQNSGNKVLGDEVHNIQGFGAIAVETTAEPPTGNVIGGDLPSEENVLTTNTSNGIVIKSNEASENEIGRNRGAVGGNFITLTLSGSGTIGPNGGIQPPPAATAFQSSARGSGAEPGARIRVFSKATEGAGELASYLGTATADASGNWRAVFVTTVAIGTLVTATQTNVLGGTSNLAASATAVVDPACPSADAVGCELPTPPPPASTPTDTSTSGSTSTSQPPPPPPAVPQTKIAKGPKAKSTNTTAKFTFTSSVAGSTFQCKLDKKKWAKCGSPKTYKNLKPGKHTFSVRAVGPTGLVAKTPTKRTFTVLE